jgi:hypothetical protein
MENNSYNLYLESFKTITSEINKLDYEKRASDLEKEINDYEKKIADKGEEYKWTDASDRNLAINLFEMDIKDYNKAIRDKSSELQNIKQNHSTDKDERQNKIKQLNVYRHNVVRNAEAEYKKNLEELDNKINNEKSRLVEERNSITEQYKTFADGKPASKSQESKVIINRLKKELSENTYKMAELLKTKSNKRNELQNEYTDFLKNLKSIDSNFDIEQNQIIPNDANQHIEDAQNSNFIQQQSQDNKNIQSDQQQVQNNKDKQSDQQQVQDNKNMQSDQKQAQSNNDINNYSEYNVNDKVNDDDKTQNNNYIEIENGQLNLSIGTLFTVSLDTIDENLGKDSKNFNHTISNMYHSGLKTNNIQDVKKAKFILSNLKTYDNDELPKNIDKNICKSFQMLFYNAIDKDLYKASYEEIVNKTENINKYFDKYVNSFKTNTRDEDFPITYDVRKDGFLMGRDFSILKKYAREARGFADVKATRFTRFTWNLHDKLISLGSKIHNTLALPEGDYRELDGDINNNQNSVDDSKLNEFVDQEINNIRNKQSEFISELHVNSKNKDLNEKHSNTEKTNNEPSKESHNDDHDDR